MRAFRIVLKMAGRGSILLIALLVLTAPSFLPRFQSNQAAGRGTWASELRIPYAFKRLSAQTERQVTHAGRRIARVFTAGKPQRVRLANQAGQCSALRQMLENASDKVGANSSCDHTVRQPLVALMPSTDAPVSMKPVSIIRPQSVPHTTSAAAPQIATVPAAPQLPIIQPLAALSDHADCSKGTLLTVVAHEDDDLLFMNPDLLNAANEGECLRTVYVTAGDGGQDQTYWSRRENGTKAAYAKLYNQVDDWKDTRATLNGKVINTSSLVGVPQLSLIFLRLPDGNLHGDGFLATQNQSLRHLLDGTLASMQTVDSSSTYSRDQLISGLLAIMSTDQPTHIHTQGLAATADGDHADHLAVGEFTLLAAQKYHALSTITQYAGYPERLFEPNLSADDIAVKQQIFFAYAAYDPAVCQNVEECDSTDSYSKYLTREFKTEVPLSVTAATSGQ